MYGVDVGFYVVGVVVFQCVDVDYYVDFVGVCSDCGGGFECFCGGQFCVEWKVDYGIYEYVGIGQFVCGEWYVC